MNLDHRFPFSLRITVLSHIKNTPSPHTPQPDAWYLQCTLYARNMARTGFDGYWQNQKNYLHTTHRDQSSELDIVATQLLTKGSSLRITWKNILESTKILHHLEIF